CAVGLVRLMHPWAQIRLAENLILMVHPQRMRHLLAAYEAPPRRCVVFRGLKIGVVELDGSLSDVRTADPDLREAEPAVVAVEGIADLDAARDRLARPRIHLPGRDHQIEYRGGAPVVPCGDEICVPLA